MVLMRRKPRNKKREKEIVKRNTHKQSEWVFICNKLWLAFNGKIKTWNEIKCDLASLFCTTTTATIVIIIISSWAPLEQSIYFWFHITKTETKMVTSEKNNMYCTLDRCSWFRKMLAWNAISNAAFDKYFKSEKHKHLHAYYHRGCK